MEEWVVRGGVSSEPHDYFPYVDRWLEETDWPPTEYRWATHRLGPPHLILLLFQIVNITIEAVTSQWDTLHSFAF